MADLTTFGEFVEVIDTLPIILRNARRARRMSTRELGKELGLSFSTVSRMENGGEFSSVSLHAVLTWLDRPAVTPHPITPDTEPDTGEATR